MLSNSNVFILLILILIKHSTLFEFTLANSVAVNARAQFDDTKITTPETVTSTSSLSHAAHFIDVSQTEKTTHTQEITANIKETTTKDPLVTGNRKEFQSITKDSLQTTRKTIDDTVTTTTTTKTSIKTTATTIPTIDHATKFNKIPSSINVRTKNGHNVSTKFEMVSNILANANTTIPSQTEISILNQMPPNKLTISSKQFNNQENLEINSSSSKSHSVNVLNCSLLMGKSNSSIKQIIEDNVNIKTVDNVNGSNDDKNDFVNSDIQLPQSDAPSPGSIDPSNHMTESNIKTRTDAVYFVVAVIGGAKIWARTLARTLNDMGPPFNDSMGSPLRPIYIDLPTNGR